MRLIISYSSNDKLTILWVFFFELSPTVFFFSSTLPTRKTKFSYNFFLYSVWKSFKDFFYIFKTSYFDYMKFFYKLDLSPYFLIIFSKKGVKMILNRYYKNNSKLNSENFINNVEFWLCYQLPNYKK